MHFHDLPVPVTDAVRAAGRLAGTQGIRLFVFGSFARGDARATSDLDLGMEVPSGISEEAVRNVRRAVDSLPTIRPVDLVDFREVSASFRERALSQRLLVTEP